MSRGNDLVRRVPAGLIPIQRLYLQRYADTLDEQQAPHDLSLPPTRLARGLPAENLTTTTRPTTTARWPGWGWQQTWWAPE